MDVWFLAFGQEYRVAEKSKLDRHSSDALTWMLDAEGAPHRACPACRNVETMKRPRVWRVP